MTSSSETTLKQKAKSGRFFIWSSLIIAAIFPVIAILKRDPRMSTTDSTKRFLVKACAENDEVAIKQLTTARGFSTLRQAMKHRKYSTYPEMSKTVARFMSLSSPFPIPGMTVNESSTSSDINDPDLSYRYDWQGWKLDNVGPWWRDDPKL